MARAYPQGLKCYSKSGHSIGGGITFLRGNTACFTFIDINLKLISGQKRVSPLTGELFSRQKLQTLILFDQTLLSANIKIEVLLTVNINRKKEYKTQRKQISPDRRDQAKIKIASKSLFNGQMPCFKL